MYKTVLASAVVLAGMASAQMSVSPAAFWDVNREATVSAQAGGSASARLMTPVGTWRISEGEFHGDGLRDAGQSHPRDFQQKDPMERLLWSMNPATRFTLTGEGLPQGWSASMAHPWTVRAARVMEPGQQLEPGEATVQREVDGSGTGSKTVAYQTRLVAQYSVSVPAGTAPGRYTLRLRVLDRPTGTVGEVPLTVTVR